MNIQSPIPNPQSPIARVLIIAGSDSGGGAGIQADLKAVSALGAFGTTAITALTAQNTVGVHGVLEIDPAFIGQQIDVVAADIGVDATKTGMLSSPQIIEVVAAKIVEHGLQPLVVDPVMMAKGGDPLLRPEAMGALRTTLLPLATVVTPNLPEAAALCGRPVGSLEDMRDAARAIRALGPRTVVVKGGHLTDEHDAVDVFFDGVEFVELRRPRFDTPHTHGTGCIFASAIAAGLAQGLSTLAAIEQAKDLITAAVRHALALGGGHGPAHAMALLYERAGLLP